MHDLERFHLKNLYAEIQSFNEFIAPTKKFSKSNPQVALQVQAVEQRAALIRDEKRAELYKCRPQLEIEYEYIKVVIKMACNECGIRISKQGKSRKELENDPV